MAAIAKNRVPATDVQIVSQMLSLTSGSFAVSNSTPGVVFKTIPANGAMMNSRINPPRKMKTNCIGCTLFKTKNEKRKMKNEK